MKKVKMLLVDDEHRFLSSTTKLLAKKGYDVETAASGPEALDKLKHQKIHVVILDVKMPGMDGIETLVEIKKIAPATEVIMLTGHGTIGLAIEAMKQGAYDFMTKPIGSDKLDILINRAWEKIRLTREAEKLAEEKRKNLFDLDTEKSRIHTIISHLPNGVIVTNTSGQVVLMNPAFRQLFNLDPGLKTGRLIEDYVIDKGLCDLVMEISRGKHIDYEDIPDYEFALSNTRYLLARGQPVLGEKNECLGAVLNVVDISDIRVLDQLKSEFVAKVSHELRSPLSTIHEQIALVIKDMMGEVSEYDQHILASAKEKTKGLIALIGDLLDLSRIEQGLICQDLKPVNVGALLENIVDFLRTQAKQKEQSITLKRSLKPLTPVTADPIALESIFGNLIANAIKYTPEGGKIQVEADMAGTNLRVKVIDNGLGIAAEHLDRIFERFFRIKNEKTRYISGTGLGLSIVKELVDSMGGLIDVESTLGKGTTFTVLFPVAG